MLPFRKWANPKENYRKPKVETTEGNKTIWNHPKDVGDTIGAIHVNIGHSNVTTVIQETAQNNRVKVQQFGNGMWLNGALMRIYPMAIFCMKLPPDQVYKLIQADIDLTNNKEFVTRAVTTYVLIMRELIKGEVPRTTIGVGHTYLEELRTLETRNETNKVGIDEKDGEIVKEFQSVELLKWMDKSNEAKRPKCCEDPPISLLDIPFKQTIWYLNYAQNNLLGKKKNFIVAMKVILIGYGDTNTNAAIVGAMLGAHIGFRGIYESEYDQYKGKEWLDKILMSDPPKHPPVIQNLNYVHADRSGYFAKDFVKEGLWQKLIDVAADEVI